MERFRLCLKRPGWHAGALSDGFAPGMHAPLTLVNQAYHAL